MNINDQQHTSSQTRRLIELGWLIVNKLGKTEFEALTRTRDQMLTALSEHFPTFHWRMPLMHRAEPLQNAHEESAMLLQEGVDERDAHHWDFVIVITRADLIGYYKPYTLGVPSRALGVAVISTSRLYASSLAGDKQERSDHLAQRLYALGMHLLGDLNGIQHSADSTSFMYCPQAIEELDTMQSYAPEEVKLLEKELSEVADTRLEEQSQANKAGGAGFYIKAAWVVKDDIFSAVIQAKPWQFPFRLSRLTTAAVSTLLILMMTAEAWDLGMSQKPVFIAVFSLSVLTATSIFILKRQKLLLRHGRKRLTEQAVAANVSISIVVALGMVATYLMLFLLVLLLAVSLFDPALVQSWAASLKEGVGVRHYLVLAALVASLGLTIGALGASFEGQNYFRHITYVDEEL